ncbi:MAG: YkvA family protein [Anaerolineae bacterium]
MKVLDSWKQRARQLRVETYAIWLAYKDPRVPWYARAFAACVVGYAFSPVDLIPDPIPVLGYLDDLVLVPLGIALALRMIPPEVMVECRQRAEAAMSEGKPTNWKAAAVIVTLWAIMASLVIVVMVRAVMR